MATPVDDLKVGDFITAVKHRDCDGRHDYNGRPVRIEAINLPFILGFDGDSLVSVDVREWELLKLTDRRYVRMAWGGCNKSKAEEHRAPDPDNTGHPRCIRCGTRLRKQFSVKKKWRMVCPTCGWTGDPVKCK